METILKAKVLTGKKRFEVAFDKGKECLLVNATERPEKGKANREIVKELKKMFKADTMIVSGLQSRNKVIKVNLPREQILQIVETN